MLEEIRKRLQASPFKPFYIRLVDGRKVPVPHPEFVWMPDPAIVHVWIPEERASEHINPVMIQSVESGVFSQG